MQLVVPAAHRPEIRQTYLFTAKLRWGHCMVSQCIGATWILTEVRLALEWTLRSRQTSFGLQILHPGHLKHKRSLLRTSTARNLALEILASLNTTQFARQEFHGNTGHSAAVCLLNWVCVTRVRPLRT